MAKLSDLIAIIPDVSMVSRATANVYAMTLRKNGMITTGGRGNNAPHMTPSDATNMVLAAFYSGNSTEANRDVQMLRNMRILRISGEDVSISDISIHGIESRFLDLLPEYARQSYLTLGSLLDSKFSSPRNFNDDETQYLLDEDGEHTLYMYESRFHLTIDVKIGELEATYSFTKDCPKGSGLKTTAFYNAPLQRVAELIAETKAA